jgi:hypothetical protein
VIRLTLTSLASAKVIDRSRVGAYVQIELERRLRSPHSKAATGVAAFPRINAVIGWPMKWKQAQELPTFLTTNDIAKILKQIEPSTNWDSFFDKYYWRTEMPPR